MERAPLFTAASFLCAALVAGCGGGGGSPLPAPSGSGNMQSAWVKFEIQAPISSTSGAARTPKFTAPAGTQSVTITLTAVNGTATSSPQPTMVDIASTAQGCSAASGTITCDVTVTAQAGLDTFTVTMYPQSGGKGTAIAAGTVTVNAAAGQTVTAPVTLSGTIASLALQIAGVYELGQSATIPVAVIAKDASGAQIMGTYNSPIALTDSDTSGATKLSATSIADSASAMKLTLAYNGAAMKAPATISASISGVASSKITNATFVPNADYPLQNGSTYTYSYSNTSQFDWAGQTPQPASTTTGTETRTITAGATFNGQNNLFDQQATKVLTNGNKSSDDSYFAWGPPGTTTNLLWYGVTGSDTASTYSDTFTQTETTPSVIDVVPHAAGLTWTPSLADTFQYSFTGSIFDSATSSMQPGTRTQNETDNADGSYTMTMVTQTTDASYKDTYQVTVKADGSASTQDDDSFYGSTITVYGTPEPNSDTAAGGMVIPVQSGTSPATLVPDWYPGGGAPPAPLSSEHQTDKGSVTIPASCNVGQGLPTTAEQIDENTSEFDPTGSVITVQTTYYEAPNVGLVCMTSATSEQQYDAAVTGSVSSTYTSSMAIALTSESLATSMRRAGFANALSGAAQTLAVQAQALHVRMLLAARMNALKTHEHPLLRRR